MDRLLTRELQMDLQLKAKEVCGGDVACVAVSHYATKQTSLALSGRPCSSHWWLVSPVQCPAQLPFGLKTSYGCRLQEERHAFLTQAATWRRAAGEKDQLLALLRRQAAELHVRDEERQRDIDCLLTQKLHMQLELSDLQVCGSGLGCARPRLCAGSQHCCSENMLRLQESSDLALLELGWSPLHLAINMTRHCVQGQCNALQLEAYTWRQTAMDEANQLALLGQRVEEVSQENVSLQQVRRDVLCALAM